MISKTDLSQMKSKYHDKPDVLLLIAEHEDWIVDYEEDAEAGARARAAEAARWANIQTFVFPALAVAAIVAGVCIVVGNLMQAFLIESTPWPDERVFASGAGAFLGIGSGLVVYLARRRSRAEAKPEQFYVKPKPWASGAESNS